MRFVIYQTRNDGWSSVGEEDENTMRSTVEKIKKVWMPTSKKAAKERENELSAVGDLLFILFIFSFTY